MSTLEPTTAAPRPSRLYQVHIVQRIVHCIAVAASDEGAAYVKAARMYDEAEAAILRELPAADWEVDSFGRSVEFVEEVQP